jgi:hypothetical protein
MENARPITVTLDDGVNKKELIVDLKQFGTGSYGWFNNEKQTLKVVVDDREVPVKVQCNLQITLIGSRPPAAKDE